MKLTITKTSNPRIFTFIDTEGVEQGRMEYVLNGSPSEQPASMDSGSCTFVTSS